MKNVFYDDVFYGMSTYEAKSISMGQTVKMNLKYGFGLGRLYHKISNEVYMEDTGFYVICNAVDKSVWVAFDFESMAETGEIDPVWPEYGQAYGKLPRDTQNMVIGIMRIFGPEWTARRPLSLNDGDPFKNGAGNPLACRLVAKEALIPDVLNVIKAGKAKKLHSKQRVRMR
jgi:hypothetical protein